MTDGSPTSSRLVGSMRALDGRGVVRMEDCYSTDIDDLWTAVTKPDRLARWIARVSGDLRVGGSFHAHFTSSWDGNGRVDVCEPPHHLLLTMSPGEPDQTQIEAWLTPDVDGTQLIIEERGLPLGQVAAHGAGWQAHVEDLAAHLAGTAPADWHTRWIALSPVYQAQALRLG